MPTTYADPAKARHGRRRPAGSGRGAAGFSLLELVVVVSVISVIAAVAVPRWSLATQRYGVSLAAHRLASDVALAQSRANYSSTSVTLSFVAGTNKYQIVGMPDPSRPNQTYTVDLGAAPYNATVSAVSFGGATQLTFDGYGNPTQGGSATVSLAGRQYVVSVDPSSGRATIQ